MKKATITVEGIVQGVGYRFFVKQIATVLGIRGLIRNSEDGRTVEIYCEAPDEKTYKLFLEKIAKKGDPDDYFRIHVADLKDFPEGTHGYKGSWKGFKAFEIDYTSEGAEPRDVLESLGLGLQHVYEVKHSVDSLASDTKISFDHLDKSYGKISETAISMDRKLGKLDKLDEIDEKLGELVKSSSRKSSNARSKKG